MALSVVEPSGEVNSALPRSSISCLSEAKFRFGLGGFEALLCRVDFDTVGPSGKRIGVRVQGEYIWAARNSQTVSPGGSMGVPPLCCFTGETPVLLSSQKRKEEVGCVTCRHGTHFPG